MGCSASLAYAVILVAMTPVVAGIIFLCRPRPIFTLSCRLFAGRVLVLSNPMDAVSAMEIYAPKHLRSAIRAGELAATIQHLIQVLDRFLPRREVMEALNHVRVYWRPARDGQYPAVRDRRPISASDVHSAVLEQMRVRGEFDGDKFWLTSFCHGPTKIECTWYSVGLSNTAFVQELVNAILWRLRGEQVAKNPGCAGRRGIDRAIMNECL